MEKRRMFIQNNLPLIIIGIFCLSLFNCITVKNAISSAYVPDELYFYNNVEALARLDGTLVFLTTSEKKKKYCIY